MGQDLKLFRDLSETTIKGLTGNIYTKQKKTKQNNKNFEKKKNFENTTQNKISIINYKFRFFDIS